MGGIGNQMFQYAFGRAQEFNGASVSLILRFIKMQKRQIDTQDFYI